MVLPGAAWDYCYLVHLCLVLLGTTVTTWYIWYCLVLLELLGSGVPGTAQCTLVLLPCATGTGATLCYWYYLVHLELLGTAWCYLVILVLPGTTALYCLVLLVLVGTTWYYLVHLVLLGASGTTWLTLELLSASEDYWYCLLLLELPMASGITYCYWYYLVHLRTKKGLRRKEEEYGHRDRDHL